LRALSWLAPLLLLTAACRGTWESRLDEIQSAYYAGDLDEAEDLLRERLADEQGGADADLLRLELAQVLQAGEHYAEASVLLAGVDGRLVVMDYSDAPVDELSRLLYAPDRAQWHATPPERLMLNVENMLNFLALGEWEEAAVEARRARNQLLRDFIPEERRYASRLVWGLAGVCLELAGSEAEAADCYRDAQVPELERRPGPGEASVLVVVQDGQAPVRVPLLVYLYAYDAPHRLQLPALVSRSPGSARVELSIDGSGPVEVPELLDLGGQAAQRYGEEFPRLLAAAALQILPRAWLSQAVERSLHDSDQPDHSARNTWARFGGFMAGELVAETLPADTRSWTLLPARVRATRLVVPAGTHRLEVTLQDPGGAEPRRTEWELELEPGGFALVQLTGAVGGGWSPVPAQPARELTGSAEAREALELLQHPSMTTP
jgi:hypothetical protein